MMKYVLVMHKAPCMSELLICELLITVSLFFSRSMDSMMNVKESMEMLMLGGIAQMFSTI